jgi:hypothetical protein
LFVYFLSIVFLLSFAIFFLQFLSIYFPSFSLVFPVKIIFCPSLVLKKQYTVLCDLLAGVTSDRAAGIDRLTPRVLGQAVRIGAAVELAQVLYTKFQFNFQIIC